MNIKSIVDSGLQYLTRRTDTTTKKKMQNVTERCRHCKNGEVVEVNVITHRKACLKCGREAK